LKHPALVAQTLTSVFHRQPDHGQSENFTDTPRWRKYAFIRLRPSPFALDEFGGVENGLFLTGKRQRPLEAGNASSISALSA